LHTDRALGSRTACAHAANYTIAAPKDRDRHRESDRGRDIEKKKNRDGKTERETETKPLALSIQGGEDAEDALSCRSFFAKEPLIIGHFCGN